MIQNFCFENYRLITLLFIDTKILASALSHRLKNSFTQSIPLGSNILYKNRYIGLNARHIQDIIDYSETYSISGVVLFLDLSKAFDSLEWNFIFNAVKKFGFGDSFFKVDQYHVQ